jgi:hypothetical protein
MPGFFAESDQYDLIHLILDSGALTDKIKESGSDGMKVACWLLEIAILPPTRMISIAAIYALQDLASTINRETFEALTSCIPEILLKLGAKVEVVDENFSRAQSMQVDPEEGSNGISKRAEYLGQSERLRAAGRMTKVIDVLAE